MYLPEFLPADKVGRCISYTHKEMMTCNGNVLQKHTGQTLGDHIS